MMRRNKSPIKSKPTFIIIVDGENEVWYFQMLKRNERALTINIKPEIPQKKTLKDQFDMVKKYSNYYSKVFWVLDIDVIIKESNEKAKSKIKPINELKEYINTIINEYHNIVIITNVPCLEFWFLLHYDKTTKYYPTCHEVVKIIGTHINNYSKTQQFYTKQNSDIYLRLKPKLKDAIEHAKFSGRFRIDSTNKGVREMYLFFETAEIKKSIL
jgi:hypothetical protein